MNNEFLGFSIAPSSTRSASFKIGSLPLFCLCYMVRFAI